VSFNQFAGYLTVDENTVRFRVTASSFKPYPSPVNFLAGIPPVNM
jgi:hypothetical protein